jgi:hypothetical protein
MTIHEFPKSTMNTLSTKKGIRPDKQGNRKAVNLFLAGHSFINGNQIVDSPQACKSILYYLTVDKANCLFPHHHRSYSTLQYCGNNKWISLWFLVSLI